MTKFERFFAAHKKTPRFLFQCAVGVLMLGTLVATYLPLGLGLLTFSLCGILSAILFTLHLQFVISRSDRLYAKVLKEYPDADKPDDAQTTWLRHSSFLLLCETVSATGQKLVAGGTAFAWDEWTLITCKHCVDRTALYTLYAHADGRKFEVDRIYKHPKLDLAYIRLKKPHGYPLLLRSAEKLAADASLWTVDLRFQQSYALLMLHGAVGVPFGKLNKSYPTYHGFYHKPGTVKLQGVPEQPADLALLSIYPGMSGSPVMHGSHVVGMLFGGNVYMCSFVPIADIVRAYAVLPPLPSANEQPPQ